MPTDFRYWYPKNKKPKIFPADFRSIINNIFSAKSALNTSWDITPAEFSRALYETGYGEKSNWSDFISFNSKEKDDFFNFLILRKNWLLSALVISNGEVLTRSFANRLDTSELNSISYHLGQAGTRISADRWMAPSRKVVRALHNSTYTKEAFLKPGALMQVVSRSEKTPDLLIEDNVGDWHVFEAKGGGTSYRPKAVMKAMKQLDSIIGVGMGGTCNPPKSSVCSFAELEKAKKLSFDVVDPPMENSNEPQTSEGSHLYFLPEVAELRAAVFSAYLLQQLPIKKTFQQQPLRKVPLPGAYIFGRHGVSQSTEEQLLIFTSIRETLRHAVLNNRLEVFEKSSYFSELLHNTLQELQLRVSNSILQNAFVNIVHAYKPTLDSDSPEYRLLFIIAEAFRFKENLNHIHKQREENTKLARTLFPNVSERIFPSLSGAIFLQFDEDNESN
ncbi:hypothetical protein [Comamonas sp. AG1104]|uniref:hypothetical protein n=1 Tax=Comamonas sp. AG1104 TaxID=2183900 RepID=UPI000E2C4C5A|nr:hypothetical protein [Comamonas sp. AG1104]RDI10588.1 hypothetical protein DFO48_10598 [Comamonas sp. AG1104]